MAKTWTKIVVYCVLAFALIGIFAQLIFNPSGFLIRLLLIVLIAGGLIYLMTNFILPWISRRRGNMGGAGVSKKYKQAVKQSKARYSTSAQKKASTFSIKNKKTTVAKKKQSPRPLKKNQSQAKLTVIEGKKNKKNVKKS